MHIENIVESMCIKFQTRNPFEIARYLNIEVLFEQLGNIKGYYNKAFRQKMIHLNQNLEYDDSKQTCAHELGHAVLHTESNTPFLRANTLFPIGKYEREADYFAVNLLYSDNDIAEYSKYSVPDIAVAFNLSEQLVAYRISVLQNRHK
jgi:Zn-dependent peptidase ImmA (M78 family)